ncbi:MAG: hypothetical protein ACK54Y_08175 [Bacteroidota bacterium]
MPIKDYSTTAANNTLTPPNGAPEGMAAGLVNNTIRQVMADTRLFYESGGWCDLGHVPTYVSATSFTIPTDVTAYYTVGRRIRMYGAIMGTLYGFITVSAYSAPNTTVTVVLDSGSLTSNLSSVLLAFTEQEAQRLADNAVTTAKIANNSVTTDKLAINSVTTIKIADGNVTAAKLSFPIDYVRQSNIQVFTSSGTYTPTGNMRFCIVEAVGGGGGGGGVSSTGSSSGRGGGGGGGGGYFRRILSAADIGASKSVTIGGGGGGGGVGGGPGGNGGTTSFATFGTATGGIGGSFGGGGVPSLGGAGGSGSGGNINVSGGTGSTGIAVNNANWGAQGGNGGQSFLGIGGSGVYVAGSSNTGESGLGFGGGGAGASSSLGAGSASGGAGANGIVIVTEFYT